MGGKLTRQWGQKIILQGRVNRLFGKEPQIKINVRFFDLLLGGDFSAIQIVNWRDVRSLSFNFLQIKKVPAGPLALFQPTTNHDPFDLFDAKGFQSTFCRRSKQRRYRPHQLNVDGDELIYSLETLVLYVNFSTYYERRRSIPLWWTVSKTSTNPEDLRKKVKNANDNQSIFQ